MTELRPAPLLTVLTPPGAAPVEERDDESLMLLAAGGHRRAFEVLARRHLGPLTGFCAKFLGNARAGEEIAQDALVQAWEHRQRYRPGRFRVFLFTIARNRCLNRARDERRRQTFAVPAPEEGGDPAGADLERPDQLDALLERERAARTREAIAALPPKLREAVLLRFDQGLAYAEIARIVRRPEVTVRSRVFHAMRRLRAAIGDQEGA